MVSRIVNQHQPDAELVFDQAQVKTQIHAEKAKRDVDKLTYVKSTLNPSKLRLLEAISEKGFENSTST